MTKPKPTDPKALRIRPRWLHRGAYIWAGLGIALLLVTGRLTSYVSTLASPMQGKSVPFDGLFLTGVLWLVATGPLVLLAVELGLQHTEARRLGAGMWRGFIESWRIAWGQPDLGDMASEFAEEPDDSIPMALVYGLSAAAMPVALFLGAIPGLRTVGGGVWIGGAGILFGITAYCGRRAAAYLEDEPSAWSFVRNWSSMNPSRYSPPGRPFVRAQITCMVALPFWWLGGGAILMG